LTVSLKKAAFPVAYNSKNSRYLGENQK